MASKAQSIELRVQEDDQIGNHQDQNNDQNQIQEEKDQKIIDPTTTLNLSNYRLFGFQALRTAARNQLGITFAVTPTFDTLKQTVLNKLTTLVDINNEDVDAKNDQPPQEEVVPQSNGDSGAHNNTFPQQQVHSGSNIQNDILAQPQQSVHVQHHAQSLPLPNTIPNPNARSFVPQISASPSPVTFDPMQFMMQMQQMFQTQQQWIKQQNQQIAEINSTLSQLQANKTMAQQPLPINLVEEQQRAAAERAAAFVSESV